MGFNSKIKQLTEDVTAKTKTSVFSSDFQEKTLLSAKISDLELELRNYKESNNKIKIFLLKVYNILEISSLSAEYFEKIGEKEAEYYRSYNSLEIQVNNALKKKVFLYKKTQINFDFRMM